ncbi:hypothetical protein OV450_1394 [Actinobacteria bacterium OV450]|nr:hypothetical protein OV450_1394 [Actinobacteria bacterium OV450]
MDTTTALHRLTNRANKAFDEDRTARARLADALTVDGAQLDGLMDAVLVTAGKAKPWHDLMKRIERHGVREGLAKQRQEATEALLTYGFSMSTSLISNAERLAGQEGLRRFLGATDSFEIEDAPKAAETSAPSKAPTRESEEPVLDKKAFKVKHGFYPHEEKCECGWRLADHTAWNTDRTFTCKEFKGTGQRG